jgi:hypothetical protein
MAASTFVFPESSLPVSGPTRPRWPTRRTPSTSSKWPYLLDMNGADIRHENDGELPER